MADPAPDRPIAAEPPGAAEVTQLLHAWRDGSREAFERLVPIVYVELRLIASRQLTREWRHDRLQITAVVNEAYLRLFHQRDVDWRNRGHFFAVAAQLMRRVLVDHARRGLRLKRGGVVMTVGLDQALGVPALATDAVDTLDLDRALTRLEAIDPAQARIIELRFFGGLSIEETAAALSWSPSSVKREWALAKGWLFRELSAARRTDSV
jgi:RNA polymerase sigma-70 factor (ECF subfamily)